MGTILWSEMWNVSFVSNPQWIDYIMCGPMCPAMFCRQKKEKVTKLSQISLSLFTKLPLPATLKFIQRPLFQLFLFYIASDTVKFAFTRTLRNLYLFIPQKEMDGLIKGLVDVALGGGGDRDGREDESQSRDERARSSWAEVCITD